MKFFTLLLLFINSYLTTATNKHNDLPINSFDDESVEYKDKILNWTLSKYGWGNYRNHDYYKQHHNELVSIRKNKHDNVFGDDHICCGVLIKPNKVLTAASCLMESGFKKLPHHFRVRCHSMDRLNESEGFFSEVDEVITHPDFNHETLENNLGILTLIPNPKHAIDYDSVAQLYEDVSTDPPSGDLVYLFGWGRLFNGGPMVAHPFYMIFNVLPDVYCFGESDVLKTMCVAFKREPGQLVCEGLLGAPLMWNNEVFAILSNGTCAPDPIPSKVTFIPAFLDFLDKNAANLQLVTTNYCMLLFVSSLRFILNLAEFI